MSEPAEANKSVCLDDDSKAVVAVGAPVETTNDASSSRRDLFKIGAALAAALVLPSAKVSAQRIVRPPLTSRPKAPPATGDALLRLVRRITNGVTEEEMARARSLGFRGYLEYHLKPETITDSAVETFVATNYPALALDGPGLYQQDQNVLMRQLSEATVYRGAFSKRQLYERMVDFWTNHFSIYYPKVNYLKLIDDRDVIRKNALGKFPDMLRASAHSPAMLEYLDNTRSRARSVNQNYGREIMELHTLGVDGGYTQTDVEEVTRALTGWTIAGRGAFSFDPTGHDYAAKTVLGNVIPATSPSIGAAGVQDGEKVLDILLAHPSTAKFISKKMIHWLLQYDPPQTLIDKVAATFTRTGGDIPSMIRDIMTQTNLLAAPAKYRQPFQLVLSALRATQPTTRGVAGISGGQLSLVGQPLFQWLEPDGYPDYVDWWAGSILQRWNFCHYLTNLSTGEVIVDVTALMQVNTPDAITDAINKRTFGGEMPAALKQHVIAYLAAVPITATRVREAFALTLSSTAFQWF